MLPKPTFHRIDSVLGEQRLSDREFAQMLNISVSEARDLRNPQSDLWLSQLQSIADTIGVGPDDLLLEIGQKRFGIGASKEQMATLYKTALAIREESKKGEEQGVFQATMLVEQIEEFLRSDIRFREIVDSLRP